VLQFGSHISNPVESFVRKNRLVYLLDLNSLTDKLVYFFYDKQRWISFPNLFQVTKFLGPVSFT
jgi:hypothetical protein